MPRRSDRNPAEYERAVPTALHPKPKLVERVIHGQRVRVKVYPPVSDPIWSDREPLPTTHAPRLFRNQKARRPAKSKRRGPVPANATRKPRF